MFTLGFIAHQSVMCPRGCYLTPCSCVSLGISEPPSPVGSQELVKWGAQLLAQRSTV